MSSCILLDIIQLCIFIKQKCSCSLENEKMYCKFSVNNDCWIWDQQNSMIIGTHGIENSRGFCPYPRPCAILGDWLPLTGKERGLHILNWNCKQILLINVYFPSDQRYFTQASFCVFGHITNMFLFKFLWNGTVIYDILKLLHVFSIYTNVIKSCSKNSL